MIVNAAYVEKTTILGMELGVEGVAVRWKVKAREMFHGILVT